MFTRLQVQFLRRDELARAAGARVRVRGGERRRERHAHCERLEPRRLWELADGLHEVDVGRAARQHVGRTERRAVCRAQGDAPTALRLVARLGRLGRGGRGGRDRLLVLRVGRWRRWRRDVARAHDRDGRDRGRAGLERGRLLVGHREVLEFGRLLLLLFLLLLLLFLLLLRQLGVAQEARLAVADRTYTHTHTRLHRLRPATVTPPIGQAREGKQRA